MSTRHGKKLHYSWENKGNLNLQLFKSKKIHLSKPKLHVFGLLHTTLAGPSPFLLLTTPMLTVSAVSLSFTIPSFLNFQAASIKGKVIRLYGMTFS